MLSQNIPLTLTPESTQIYGHGYDLATQTLAVEYESNHEVLTYHYKGVPPELAAQLETAPSAGAFIHKQIKSKFDFDRIQKAPKEAEAQA